jgi:hypothetical protein
MNFPSLQSATDYIESKLRDFYDQRTVLTDRLRKIQLLKDAAMKSNNQQALGQLIVLRQGVVDLLNEHFLLQDRIKPFASYFGFTPPQLGALPLILAGVAIALAASLYLYYEKLDNQAKALDLVARGILPADQAESILNPGLFSGAGGQITTIMMLAVGGYALFLFGPMLSNLLGGRR